MELEPNLNLNVNLSAKDFNVTNLGECTFESPVKFVSDSRINVAGYERDERRVLFRSITGDDTPIDQSLAFELAGPRRKLFFNPKVSTCAIVTCGGLCPGMNNVVRSMVMYLYHVLGVRRILGIRYGYRGLNPKFGLEPIDLNPEAVKFIHERGGTFLGSSRGEQTPELIVDTLSKWGVNCFFPIGGDGTFKGAHRIVEEIKNQGKKISVVGVPKTIDNDINFIDKTFGFETAVAEAARAIRSAHVEAIDAPNGIGIVKLMGRHSGYVAAYAALSLREVNLVLIPEQTFSLEAIYRYTEKRLRERGHIVIVVAEGAGQEFFANSEERDASGNKKLHDIGIYLSSAIKSYFKQKKIDINLKYIDPSYMIRSIPAIPTDSAFTGFLGQYAVDAAFAGKTDLAIGYWKGFYTHLPFSLATSSRRIVALEGDMWHGVLRATGQPQELK